MIVLIAVAEVPIRFRNKIDVNLDNQLFNH